MLELGTAARRDDARDHTPALDDAQRRQLLDPEPVDQIWTVLGGDAVKRERVVVVAALQHLSEEPLHPAAASRRRRKEEEETGSFLDGPTGLCLHPSCRADSHVLLQCSP